MKSLFKHFATLLAVVAFVACSQKTAPTATAEADVYDGPRVTYADNIAPLMERSCSPCHYPNKDGKKMPLDSYAAVKDELNDVLIRVQLPKDNKEFMPYKHKRQDLSAEEIEMLKNWARGGFIQG